MGKTLFSDPDKYVDSLLRELGNRGMLDTELNEDDLDLLLAAAPPVSLSTGFDQRARTAIADAQSGREKRNPAVALGTVVARARSQAGLELAEAAGKAGVSAKLLEALEIGQLSARQILRNFPPAVAVQLLAAVELAVHEFTSRLMDLAATGGRVPMTVATRTTNHRRQRDTAALVMKVADYVAVLQRMAQSKELSDR